MIHARGAAVVLALACAMAAAACGLGPGGDEGVAEVTVTRDYGAEVLADESPDLKGSDNVMRALDRSADVETRYGGRFVQSIDGLGGGQTGGRLYDWFFYVNGIEAPRGAADFDLSAGDRVWWDFHDWTDAMRVPAVVGSWPEPFVNGFDGRRYEVSVDCRGAEDACDRVRGSLEHAGARLVDSDEEGVTGSARVMVGPWERIRRDGVARLVEQGPGRSGVFADFYLGAPEGWQLVLQDASGAPSRTLGPGSGLIAALLEGEGPPTWLVTGTDPEGTALAAESLAPDALRNRFAVAIEAGGKPEPVPTEGAP
ncbi:MAG: DUF4430 domain-containing protein [Solirubrobacterales bacterium]|nr:DUF4430 domain-containing protein [Solirubrobacterales bacterium]